MNERIVEIGSCGLQILEAGEGPALIFVHGLTFDHHMWAAQVAALQDRFRVITLDLRGHGETRWNAGEVTIGDLADDIAHLLDALGLENAAYCGLSIGGMVGRW